jgi:hypothetical protein
VISVQWLAGDPNPQRCGGKDASPRFKQAVAYQRRLVFFTSREHRFCFCSLLFILLRSVPSLLLFLFGFACAARLRSFFSLAVRPAASLEALRFLFGSNTKYE